MIKVRFNFTDHYITAEFDVCDGLQGDVDDFAADYLDDLETQEDFEGYEVIEWDTEFDPEVDFNNLDDYARHVELIDKHGEKYELRYDDIGDSCDYDESQYEGVWDSPADYAREHAGEGGTLSSEWVNYIDWDAYAEDLLTNHSVYYGSEGYHIFKDY